MTIRELYEWARDVGALDKPLTMYSGDGTVEVDLDDMAEYEDEIIID